MSSDADRPVMLLTGATEGIGKAAARVFARSGATLVLVGRNRDKTESLLDTLKRESQNERIESILGDLSTLSGIRSVAATFRERHERLDVLANNAGAVFAKHRLSNDGFEMTFALNHLSYFLLTHELLPILGRTPNARVVNTSSAAHRRGAIDLATIAKRPSGRAGFAAYCDSKLANVLFTRELARRLAGRDVAVSCFHPGFVRSGFGQNNEGLMRWGIALSARFFGRTPEQGAETLLWLATSPDAAKMRGEYVHDRAVADVAPRARDDEAAARLWRLSEACCGIT